MVVGLFRQVLLVILRVVVVVDHHHVVLNRGLSIVNLIGIVSLLHGLLAIISPSRLLLTFMKIMEAHPKRLLDPGLVIGGLVGQQDRSAVFTAQVAALEHEVGQQVF